MKRGKLVMAVVCFCHAGLCGTLEAQEVMYVNVHDEAREKAEKNAAEGYLETFAVIHLTQQKALNYKRRMLTDHVFVTEFQREALNSDLNIDKEISALMEKNVQKLRIRIDEIWAYYDETFMNNPLFAPAVRTYYEAKKKQVLEDTALVDRKADAFVKGEGVDHTLATPRQRMEAIREIRKEYQKLCGISLKQSSLLRSLVIGKTESGNKPEERKWEKE